jgi:hypothetical protein
MTAAARIGRCVRVSILCVQVLGTALCLDPAPAAAEYSQDAVMAAYLFRFAQYVDWPGNADAAKPFVIAVVGSPAVASELRRLVPGHPINNRVVEVVEANRVTDLGRCGMLFIGGGYAELLRPALAELAAASTLVITDEDGGLDEGATLNFLNLDHRVRFEVSLTGARRAHLKISAELLAVAARVTGGGRS